MSARRTDKATKAVVALLEGDESYEGPEDMAVAIINAVDAARAAKTSYVAVMQFGEVMPFYVGVGPYAGIKSAANAIGKHPAFREAKATAVVPVNTPEHVAKVVGDLDAQPELSGGDWALVREDAAMFKRGWKGKQADREQYRVIA